VHVASLESTLWLLKATLQSSRPFSFQCAILSQSVLPPLLPHCMPPFLVPLKRWPNVPSVSSVRKFEFCILFFCFDVNFNCFYLFPYISSLLYLLLFCALTLKSYFVFSELKVPQRHSSFLRMLVRWHMRYQNYRLRLVLAIVPVIVVLRFIWT
jgi:hypothetical protein